MNTYPTKYDTMLNENEEIIWHEKGKPVMTRSTYIGSSIVIIVIIIFILIISVHQYTLGLAPFLFFLVVCYFMVYYLYTTNNTYYLATSQRIIIDTHPKRKYGYKSYSYSKIHEIGNNSVLGSDSIVFFLSPRSSMNNDTERQMPYLRKIDHPKETLQLIQNAWLPESPFNAYADSFESVANKYGLEIARFHPTQQKKLMVFGTVNGMEVSMGLGSIFDLRSLKIRINCPNSEKNYLRIKREGLSTSIGKMAGVQDLKTNFKAFDDRFLLQSDNQHFFDTILTDFIQQDLLDAGRMINWEITFGAKPSSNKSKEKNSHKDIDVLDAHLFNEIPEVNKREEGKITTLYLNCDNLFSDSLNIALIVRKCSACLDVMIELAKEIQKYDK